MVYTLAGDDADGPVIRAADGATIPADPGNADWRGYLAWRAAGNTAAGHPAPPDRPPVRRIRALAFRRRMGSALLAVTQAAMADATLRMHLDDLSASLEVDLDDPATAAGVAAYRGAGLITGAQAVALLADGAPDEAA